jgi:hypothetical protein
MMTTQEMYSLTNPIQASKTSSAMSIAQIDQALRDFVLQDTAHLRRDVETAFQGGSRREPRGAPQMVSDLVRQMAGASLNKLDETIADLSQVRDFLHTEGERIKREISGYLQLNQVAMGSAKLVVDNIAQVERRLPLSHEEAQADPTARLKSTDAPERANCCSG